jgi:hypothetical protein
MSTPQISTPTDINTPTNALYYQTFIFSMVLLTVVYFGTGMAQGYIRRKIFN